MNKDEYLGPAPSMDVGVQPVYFQQLDLQF